MNRVAMTTRRHEPGPATTGTTVPVESAVAALLANPVITEPLRNALREAASAGVEHEERDLSPQVPESVTEQEWREFEKSNTDGAKPPELAFIGHWMLDNLE